MNKIIWISAAVLSVAACAKNEVVPVNSGENQEITFNVAPKTKAEDAHHHTEFGKDKVFASWAYYLPEGSTWNANSADAKEYISGATISYNTTEKVWKAKDKTYYWPKNGSLTFFAYSLYKDNLTLAAGTGFTCDPGAGITGHINLNENHNTDFLVADIAQDMKSNDNVHFTNGVPTLFKHRLSSVAFAIKTGDHYTNKKFELTNITFHNLSQYGAYAQLPTESCVAGDTKYDPVFTSALQEIPYQTNFVDVTGVDKYIFIPQTFAKGSNANENAYIEVKYTITTTVACTTPEGQPSTKEVVEEVTKNIFLNPATGTPMFDKWEMGKKYTIKLTFTLDEILWDPAVEDWEDVTPATDHIVE